MAGVVSYIDASDIPGKNDWQFMPEVKPNLTIFTLRKLINYMIKL